MIHEQLKKDAPGKTCKGPEEKACWKKDMKRLQWLEFDEGVTVETKVEQNEGKARSLARQRFDLVNQKAATVF